VSRINYITTCGPTGGLGFSLAPAEKNSLVVFRFELGRGCLGNLRSYTRAPAMFAAFHRKKGRRV